MTHKEKILQFAIKKGLNKTKFCKTCGFSNGYLDSKGAVTSDKLTSILKHFNDFNIYWLLLDEGDMIFSPKNANSPSDEIKKSSREKTVNELTLSRLNSKVEMLQKEIDILKEKN